MPTVSVSTPTYRMSRTWVRNGPGPKVPHAFSFSMAIIRKNTDPATFTVRNGGAGTHTGSVPADLRLRLYRKLRDSAYESMQLGADFGERRQTIEMIAGALRAVRSPLKTVGDYMRRVAKRKGRDIGSVLLKDSADAFLAFQYGVKPFMGSIQDLCNVLQRPYPRTHVRQACVARYSDPIYVANQYPQGRYSYIERADHFVALRGGFDIEVENPTVFSAEQMGLLNPLSVAWELVPFSFVVDWFIPVGTYINSLSDYAGCSLTHAYCTEFVRTTGFRSYTNLGRNCEDESIRNIRTLGIPTLPPLITLGLKLDQSKQHVANALALLLSLKIKV